MEDVGRDISNESESSAVQSADESLSRSIVADCLPDRVHAGAEHRIRNDAAAPDRAKNLLAADHPLAVLDQEVQEVEHLGFD